MHNYTFPILTGTVTEDLNEAVEGVSNLSKLISQHGPLIVICAVFIIAFITMFLFFIRMISKLNETINRQVESKNEIIDDIVRKFTNGIIEKDDESSEKKEEEVKKKKDLVGIFMNHTTIFKQESIVVINKTKCDRVGVYVFHNGNQALYGLPFIKMSCIFEETLKGNFTNSRGLRHSNLPLHLFTGIIDSVFNNDGVFAGTIDKSSITDNSFKLFTEGTRIRSIFIKGIQADENQLAGFSICEFDEDIDFSNKDVYDNINNSLNDFNNAIKYIIVNEEFRDEHIFHGKPEG